MSTPAIVVIGGGVAGLSTAMHAAESGCSDVVVLEQEHLAHGSSSLSAGSVNTNGIDPQLLEIKGRTRALMDKLQNENNLHLAHFGMIRMAKLEEQLALFERGVETHRSLGQDPLRVITPDEITAMVPAVRTDDLVGGLYDPQGVRVDGYQLCAVLADRVKAAGGQVLQKTQVVGIERGTTKRHLLRTSNGDFEADVVVNAAGGWADKVGDMLGCPVHIVNELHTVVQVRVPGGLPHNLPMLQDYVPGYAADGWISQESSDLLIAGFHTEVIGEDLPSQNPDSYSRAVTADKIEEVAEYVSNRLLVDDIQFGGGWTGLYPVARDGNFLVGPYASDPTVVAIAGLGGLGIQTCLALGSLASEYIVHGQATSILDAASLLPDRDSLLAV